MGISSEDTKHGAIANRIARRWQQALHPELKALKDVMMTTDTVEVSCLVQADAIGMLLEFLQHCEKIGGGGHSFSIVVDPDFEGSKYESGYYRELFFDGDGADRITDVRLNGEIVTEDFLGNE